MSTCTLTARSMRWPRLPRSCARSSAWASANSAMPICSKRSVCSAVCGRCAFHRLTGSLFHQLEKATDQLRFTISTDPSLRHISEAEALEASIMASMPQPYAEQVYDRLEATGCQCPAGCKEPFPMEALEQVRWARCAPRTGGKGAMRNRLTVFFLSFSFSPSRFPPSLALPGTFSAGTRAGAAKAASAAAAATATASAATGTESTRQCTAGGCQQETTAGRRRWWR